MRICALVAMLVLSSCGGNTGKLIDEHRAVATAKLAQIKALAPIVEKLAPITQATWKIPAGVKIDLDLADRDRKRPAGEGIELNPKMNATAMFQEGLAKPCESEYPTWDRSSDWVWVSLIDRSQVPAADCLLATGKLQHSNESPRTDEVTHALYELEHAQYVLVARVRTKHAPETTGEQHYDPGHVAGDFVLLDVATGAVLGGFPFDATLGDSLLVKSRGANDQLRNKLSDKMRDQINDALKAAGIQF